MYLIYNNAIPRCASTKTECFILSLYHNVGIPNVGIPINDYNDLGKRLM